MKIINNFLNIFFKHFLKFIQFNCQNITSFEILIIHLSNNKQHYLKIIIFIRNKYYPNLIYLIESID